MRKVLKQIGILSLLLIASSNFLLANEKVKGDSTRGVTLWANLCIHCHNVREPAELTKRAWKFSMQHMRVRAGLTGVETRDILAFILETKTAEDVK